MSNDLIEESEYIEFRLYLVGEPKVGKHSFMNRLLRMPCTKTILPNQSDTQSSISGSTNNKNENKNDDSFTTDKPSKLYNINRYKLVFKSIYVPPLERLAYDYEPKFLDDSDYEVEKTHKVSLRRIKFLLSNMLKSNELCIPFNKLHSFNISIENLFIFMWDLSNYETFEQIEIYYDNLVKKYNVNDSEKHNRCVLIGNKNDKRIVLDYNQQQKLDEFISKHNVHYYEISTRPFFAFEKFFHSLFYDVYGDLKEMFHTKDFEDIFKLILMSRSSFAKSERKDTSIHDLSSIPGPGSYDLNIFGYINQNEIKDALTNKKTRFKKKIFAIKSGPVLVRNKYEDLQAEKLQEEENKKKHMIMPQDAREPIDKIKPGFTFGSVMGSLNLKQKRREIQLEKREIIQNSLNEESSNLILHNSKSAAIIRDENYFKDALERKNNYQNNLAQMQRERYDKLMEIHKQNLEKQELKKEQLKNSIFENQRLHLSSSLNDISTEQSSDIQFLRQKAKERYYQALFPNNKKHIEKTVDKSNLAIYHHISPAPNAYDIRGNLCNPKKGFTIKGKVKEIKKHIICPEFPNIKGDFELIAERVNNRRIDYGERFKPLKKEPEDREKKYEKKWLKWEQNKSHSERSQNLKLYLENRNILKSDQEVSFQKIQNKHEEKILNSRGYDPEADLRPINYRQIEQSSPSYTITGRNYVKEPGEERVRHILRGAVNYVNNEITGNAFPLPNYNYIKPNLPAFSFEKSERFPIMKEDLSEIPNLIFLDGKFTADDRSNFLIKEPYSSRDPKCQNIIRNNYPGPSDYQYKSFSDIIVEKGKKINENRIRIQKENELKTQQTKSKTISPKNDDSI